MTDETNPIVRLTDEDLEAMLRRAFRNTLVLGLASALVVFISAGWRNAGMLAAGAAISVASILEWRRLVRLINAKLDQKKAPRGAVLVVAFFVLRLTVYAAVIYGSLKCFHGSVIALLYGLCLAVVAMVWEAFRLLRD